MHAARRPVRTSRRTVSCRGRRYSVCGLSLGRNEAAERIASAASLQRLWWRSGALLLAFTICAAYVVCSTPVVVADPAHGARSLNYTIDDFANAARYP